MDKRHQLSPYAHAINVLVNSIDAAFAKTAPQPMKPGMTE
jgi:hypothetical protein